MIYHDLLIVWWYCLDKHEHPIALPPFWSAFGDPRDAEESETFGETLWQRRGALD